MKVPLKVMYAEDDGDIRLIAKMAMELEGTLTVQDYPSGIGILENVYASNPDVIVLDSMMAGLNGPDTLKKLKEFKNCENIPVIFLTSSVEEENVARYYALGAIGVIEKPFEPMSLCKQIISLYNANKIVQKYIP